MPKKQKKEKFTTEKYLDKKLEEHAKIIIAAVDSVIEKRLKKTEERLEKKIDNVQTLIDGYVKAQEEFKQEFIVMKEEVKQIKNALKAKLGIEIRAI